ncbi:hypothetical protein LAZ67_16001800 [Cordylochernes scorpioides]|uniref:Ig-like domain-containing protein n=1 Tax=Cordylochernes scorpioides TaxID=51811 RepID=A0ABY6LBT7_9ARAC|nr:hypothetical protein LAZ67_16001800 [Cordylochernes scorpioides]
MDQRTCIKFCVKNEIKCADAFRMLTVAYGESTLDRCNVYRWYKMFSEGREDVNDEERAGRPSTSTTDEKINEVEKMILANRRITVREVAEDLNISIGSCHSIFINDLGMRRVTAKFVPKLLNCDQKQHRMNIANEMLDSVRDDPNLLQRVITGDEAWVYGYDVETKAQSSQWKLPHEPRPKKARQVRSNVKVLLTVFFDCRGVVHHEFSCHRNKNWLLHHDNAPAHTSLLVRDVLAKNNTLMMPQPPYSPDLAPCAFFLFPKLKRPMKGQCYATLDEIKTASKEELKKIFKNDFLKCFEDWKNRWHKCIISHGDYFEGNKIVSPVMWIPHQLVGTQVDTTAELDCHAEAYPGSITYWAREPGEQVILPSAKYDVVAKERAYKTHMRLVIRNIERDDLGTYKCFAKNSLGSTEGSINLYGEKTFNEFINVLTHISIV